MTGFAKLTLAVAIIAIALHQSYGGVIADALESVAEAHDAKLPPESVMGKAVGAVTTIVEKALAEVKESEAILAGVGKMFDIVKGVKDLVTNVAGISP